MAQLPTWTDFANAAQTANLIGLGTSISFDHETAITLADRFSDEADFFLLESAPSGASKRARFSYIGFGSIWSWRSDLSKGQSTSPAGTQQVALTGSNPVAAFYREFRRLEAAHLFAEQPAGLDLNTLSGATGFIGYDVAASLEPRLGTPPRQELGLPATYFIVPRFLMILDQLTHRLHLICYNTVDGSSPPEALRPQFAAAEKALQGLVAKLGQPHRAPPLRLASAPLRLDTMQHSVQAPEFYKLAARCMDDIRRGEIFQIQIGNRLSQKTSARPFDMFRHLRILNPSPYMFFLRCEGRVIFGASPEMMVGLEQGCVMHRPIAGTRKRTWQTAADERRKAELIASEKERAEHVMLVDLSRNDIGRIAQAGSVRVSDLMLVEEYSHVFHMVSQVQGTLLPEFNAADAMIASFPNGTVSGAPKIRAMELIYRYEPVAREFYAGSLGMFTFSGDLKSTLLIRSVCVSEGIAYTQASAGMVYDSVPEHEWQETRHKMAACVTAIQNTL